METLDTSAAFQRRDPVRGRYPVNLRFTIPFYPHRLFVTLIIGREKRGPERLREERARHPLHTWGNLFALVTSWTVLSIAALFAALFAVLVATTL